MERITIRLGNNKEMEYHSSMTEGQILISYKSIIHEDGLPSLLNPELKGCDVPGYLIGAYKAKGYSVSKFDKGCGTYRLEVIPDLIFQVVSKYKDIRWERIE